ncbi:hypothetical protein RhiJN_22119 [Ceratobasidium sp. AG-Ba]|nr:hypothetical protein RhiJN_22119 [Ceratobasidium sp. AG-Ba]
MVFFKWFTRGDCGGEAINASKPETDCCKSGGSILDVPYSDDPEEVPLLVGDTQVGIISSSLARQFSLFNLQLDESLEAGEAKGLKLSESKENVEAIMSVLSTSEHDKKSIGKLSIETLISSLVMATKYENPTLRGRVIKILDSKQQEIPPAKRVGLARTCNIPTWTRNAIHELCERKESITPEEEAMIGTDMMVPIARQRKPVLAWYTPPKRLVTVALLLNALVVPLNFLAHELYIHYTIGEIAETVILIVCNAVPFALLLPLVAVLFIKSGAANRRTAVLRVICIILVVLPGLLVLREPIAVFLSTMITNVLWPADLYFISPGASLVFTCFVLMEMAYFYGSKSLTDLVGRLAPPITHTEPSFVPWPSHCPVCKHKVGDCEDKNCERCMGGRTLYN